MSCSVLFRLRNKLVCAGFRAGVTKGYGGNKPNPNYSSTSVKMNVNKDINDEIDLFCSHPLCNLQVIFFIETDAVNLKHLFVYLFFLNGLLRWSIQKAHVLCLQLADAAFTIRSRLYNYFRAPWIQPTFLLWEHLDVSCNATNSGFATLVLILVPTG